MKFSLSFLTYNMESNDETSNDQIGVKSAKNYGELIQ